MLQESCDLLCCDCDELDLSLFLDANNLSLRRKAHPEINLPPFPHRPHRDLPKMHVEFLQDLEVTRPKL